MNAFSKARTVEARGFAILLPFLKERAHDGQLVMTSKGALARHLQEAVGDVGFNSDAERFWGIEVKIEEKHTGNLFLETWSNRNLEKRGDHATFGSNVGWLAKLRADLLFYYFLNTDTLYIMDLFKLKRWAFGHNGTGGHIYEFREVPQNKYAQANDTHGRLVPVEILQREVGARKVYPRQIDLFTEAAN